MAPKASNNLPTHVTLESLRGMAALLVAMFHFNFVSAEKLPLIAQGTIFVDFFFVLSGFVMALAYFDRIKAGFNFFDFAILRMGRLYPLHIFILLCWLPYVIAKYVIFTRLGLGSDPTEHNNIQTIIQNIFMLQSFGVHDALSWNGPSWSISAELFAYFAFFVVIAFLPKIAGKWLFTAVSVASFALLFAISGGGDLLKTYDYGFLRCLSGFFAGAALYLFLREVSGGGQRQLSFNAASTIEIAAFVFMIACVLQMQSSPLMQLASFASFAVVIAVFSQQESGIISKLLKQKWMVYLGTVSYSLYMVHSIIAFAALDFAIYILKMTVVVTPAHGKLVLTPWAPLFSLVYLSTIIAISHVTYRWIEQPFRDNARALVANRRVKRTDR